ncbi:MAG: ADP-ribosylglycohydrolase family protein [Cytophagales bacterium]|nr:ADP-ribosylglycohydrolase family protein [Cytophagales bacterium]
MNVNKLILLSIALMISCNNEKKIVNLNTFTLSKSDILDKIKGGWAGQTIGVCFGQPTEFSYYGLMQDHVKLKFDSASAVDYFNNDDIYVDVIYADVIERLGLEAPADSFATALAYSKVGLAHANQACRYNVKRGIMPPQSGHWKNNPHADDLDFQINADFIGLMSPGIPNSALKIADKVGHIVNYGDGWYGGVFIAACYSLAFVYDDVETVLKEALKAIPVESEFYKCINAVIDLHKKNPTDWKYTWFEIEKKFNEDIACSEGTLRGFNIDAKINSAYVVIGLLYGEGDFTKTIEIATRCGQDSDCNPASAGGILGAIKGYKNIPDNYLTALKVIENRKLNNTRYSLSEAYQLSLKHSLINLEKANQKITDSIVTITYADIVPVPFEKSFENLIPTHNIGNWFGNVITPDKNNLEFDFEGAGILIRGTSLVIESKLKEYTHLIEINIDNQIIDTMAVPSFYLDKINEVYWNFELEQKNHHLKMRIVNPADGAWVKVTESTVFNKRNK